RCRAHRRRTASVLPRPHRALVDARRRGVRRCAAAGRHRQGAEGAAARALRRPPAARPDAGAVMRTPAASLGGVAALDGGRALLPGLLACGVIAAASAFLAQHYGAPVMLFGLLLGTAMNFLSAEGACKPGIEFAARHVLRVGIALLGLR